MRGALDVSALRVTGLLDGAVGDYFVFATARSRVDVARWDARVVANRRRRFFSSSLAAARGDANAAFEETDDENPFEAFARGVRARRHALTRAMRARMTIPIGTRSRASSPPSWPPTTAGRSRTITWATSARVRLLVRVSSSSRAR